jgi:hypothetical protein
VVSDRSGDVYALGETRAPQRAHDLAGRDVTALVAARDERYWLGGPTLRDASGSSQVRDGIVVEFPRPPSADAARLVVSVRNTPWASYLLRHTLELMGPELDTWYARMNTSPAERQRFARAWLREGMLRVEIEEASGWRPGGTVWDVGPELSKWQVVPLRLPAGNPGVLRLRLSSTVAHWMIDAIAVDYGSGASVRTTRVAATSAIDGRGNDLREVLRAEDRRRHPMPSIGDRIDLVFDAPAWPDGHDRTVMLESTGYYTIHADSTGAPRVELFERLIDEPGAYGSYTVALLNDYLDRSVGAFGAD